MLDLTSNTGRKSSEGTTRGQKKLRGRSLDGPRIVKERTKKIGSISPVRRAAKGTRGAIDKLRESDLDCLDFLIAETSPNTHEPPSNEQRKAVLASLDEALSSWDDADEDSFDAPRTVQKNQRGRSSKDANRGQMGLRGRSLDRMKKIVEGARKLVVRNSNEETRVKTKERSRSLGRMTNAREAKKILSSSPIRPAAKKSSSTNKQRGTRGTIDTLRQSDLDVLDEFIVDGSPNKHDRPSNKQRKIVLASLDDALSSWEDVDDSFEF